MTDLAFDDIVAGFYRAASGAIGWVEALVPFQRAMSAAAVHLHGIDLSRQAVAFSYPASDMRAETEVDYVRTYHRIDPRANLVLTLQPGEWMHCWQHFDDDFVAGNRFYQEFLIPYGCRYSSGVKLLETDSLSVMLGVHRSCESRPLDAAEIETCTRLARHLTTALMLNRDAIQQRQQGQLGMELLTRLRAPVALIDEERRLRHANPAAQALLAGNRAVVESVGRLYCRRPKNDSELLIGLLHLFRGNPVHPSHPPVDKVFLRAQTGTGDAALGLYLYAIRPQETLHAFGDQPLAMLVFHDPGARLELDPFVVAAAFDLTPAEARVAVSAGQGASADEIARQHTVSTHTVRSQLKTIFQKTGTCRHAELVSLLAALPMAALGLGKA
jgi:DNA-binding CsgD family transcriptional regulator